MYLCVLFARRSLHFFGKSFLLFFLLFVLSLLRYFPFHLVFKFIILLTYNILLQVELFEELARIFSEDNNRWAQRELLMREGTAKFADTVGENDRQLQKVFQRQLNNSGVS